MGFIPLFLLASYWWFYGLFTLFVLGLLALDLGVFHRKTHVVSAKEAFAWTMVWISLAIAFCAALYFYAQWKLSLDPRLAGLDHAALATQTALEFLAGYVIEASLSVDNSFVFVVVLGYFAVPPHYQHRVLFHGILGALVFRGVFISLGALLMQFHWVILFFGGFLILTGIKILFTPEHAIAPERNPVLRLLRRLLPVTRGCTATSFSPGSTACGGRLRCSYAWCSLSSAISCSPWIRFRRVRHHPGATGCFYLQRLRHPWPAVVVLSPRRRDAQIPFPEIWSGCRVGLRRPQNGLAERGVWRQISISWSLSLIGGIATSIAVSRLRPGVPRRAAD